MPSFAGQWYWFILGICLAFVEVKLFSFTSDDRCLSFHILWYLDVTGIALLLKIFSLHTKLVSCIHLFTTHVMCVKQMRLRKNKSYAHNIVARLRIQNS